MQANIKSIIKDVAKKENMDADLLQAVASTVFKELRLNQEKPKSLIIKLKGIGSWFLRKQQMERKLAFLEEYYHYSEHNTPDDKSEKTAKYWENKEIKEVLEERLKDYDRYLSGKNEVKRQRLEGGFTKLVDLEDDE